MVDFGNLLFRASSMGDIMTGVEKGWSWGVNDGNR